MTAPCVSMIAQDASCDSRMMVEKPVRNSEFCISCTMPERVAFTTSSSIASSAILCLRIRDDQVLPFVHARRLPGANERGAIELIEDRRSGKPCAYIQLLALIYRTIDLAVVESHAPALAHGPLDGYPGR